VDVLTGDFGVREGDHDDMRNFDPLPGGRDPRRQDIDHFDIVGKTYDELLHESIFSDGTGYYRYLPVRWSLVAANKVMRIEVRYAVVTRCPGACRSEVSMRLRHHCRHGGLKIQVDEFTSVAYTLATRGLLNVISCWGQTRQAVPLVNPLLRTSQPLGTLPAQLLSDSRIICATTDEKFFTWSGRSALTVITSGRNPNPANVEGAPKERHSERQSLIKHETAARIPDAISSDRHSSTNEASRHHQKAVPNIPAPRPRPHACACLAAIMPTPRVRDYMAIAI